MIGAALLVAAAAAVALGAPWWVCGLIVTPALVLGAGLGWARWLDRAGAGTRLSRGLDAAWVGLLLTWVDVALVREVGLRDLDAGWGLLGLAGLWCALGLAASRRAAAPRRTPRLEAIGVALVAASVVGLAAWRADDLARPLDGYWYVADADHPPQEPLDLRPGLGWGPPEPFGWPEAGALKLTPTTNRATLATVTGASGRVALAVRGPIGSRLSVAGREITVQHSMMEEADEGAVRRYLDRGTAGLVLELDLAPGEELPVEVTGDAVYLLPGSDAVWALHAAGELRYTHYYQLLNQVENQVWAEEVLEDRWFTWNQPPGWSPILATSTLLVRGDLPGANLLLLWVLALVGASGVRLGGSLAPDAPLIAAAAPAGLVACHGLMMLEPASANFPDSLYAAAILATATAAVERRRGWFGGLGAASQALRWPGAVFGLLLLGAAWVGQRVRRPLPYAGLLLGLVALGGLVAAAAMATGHADDLLFVLYFETFPEHWHDDYAPTSLLPRIPAFYGRWLAYTGGGLALAAVALGAGRDTEARAGGRGLLLAALAYSALLCTVDHHPTHYYLPLVALTGPLVMAGAASLPRRAGIALAAAHLVGIAIFLHGGRVW